jgi:hypothetical protein
MVQSVDPWFQRVALILIAEVTHLIDLVPRVDAERVSGHQRRADKGLNWTAAS